MNIFEAVLNNDINEVNRYIKSGGDVNIKKDDDTLLYVAYNHDKLDIFRLLLKQPDIDVNCHVRFHSPSYYLLHLVLRGYEEYVPDNEKIFEYLKLLLEHPNINLSLEDEYGNSAIRLIASFNNYKDSNSLEVKYLKKIIDLPEFNINYKDEEKSNILNYACWFSKVEFVQLLLGRPEIEINNQNNYGDTPLNHACKNNRYEIVELLLTHPDINVNIQNYYSFAHRIPYSTPLHTACKNNSKGIIKLLLKHPKINVNIKDSAYSQTALFIAFMNQNLEAVELLLENPNINVNIKSYFNSDKEFKEPLLNLALTQQDQTICKLLLSRPEIDVNLTNQYNKSPLEIACNFGQSNEIISLILSHMDTNDVNSSKHIEKALFSACEKDHKWLIPTLLPYIQNINAVNDRGESFLNVITWFSNTNIVKLFLNRPDIDVNIQDIDGEAALHRVRSKDVLSLLLTHPKININIKNKKGNTPLHKVCERDLSLLEPLLNHPNIQPNIQNKEGETALHYLCSRTYVSEYDNFLELFLSYSKVNINIQDKKGKTPIDLIIIKNKIATSGNKKNILFLLKRKDIYISPYLKHMLSIKKVKYDNEVELAIEKKISDIKNDIKTILNSIND